MFESLSESDRKDLGAYTEVRSLKRRELAWEDGHKPDAFSFVLRGRLKLVKTNEQGRETIVDVVLPGALMCPNAACAKLAYCCDAVAMEDQTQVASIPREQLYRLMRERPGIVEALIREAACRNAGLCRRVEELASGQVERRIATLLLRLSEQLGQPRGGAGTLIPLTLSRQDIADMCGTTVETTIRIMSRLNREGVVLTDKAGFIVARSDQLRDVARGAAD